MAEQIRIDTGSVDYEVIDKNGNVIGEFEFVPTDVGILNRYEKVIDFFNSKKFSDSIKENELIEFSNEIKEQFDYLFNYPVSDGLFAKCDPLTVTANGDFFFEAAIDAIAKVIESTMKKRVDKKLAMVKKVTEKYHK